LPVRLADAPITCEHTLKTREPSYVPRAAKHLFIPVVHNPLEAVGHMVALALPRR
jgi:hypothetical protein